MTQPLNFQQVILKLHQYWSEQGCVIWEPYNVQVGAGTSNPATLLRVLGPEPWRVAYVEPSVRPDDGRFGDNPNRMQKYFQYQVILKPDPGNPQELYLASLAALGIDAREHDIRFVEDNWQNPSLGAWGLGWEVWLDGQEITQFTYFQQAGGMELDPISVEITYGLERIVLALQEKESAWQIDWVGDVNYKDMMFEEEVEHCRYYFDIADVEALQDIYNTYEREVTRALEGDAIISAYDYVLKCSHLFNVLDTRGAIGVTERAKYFYSMRDMTRSVARAYADKREAIGHPMLKMMAQWGVETASTDAVATPDVPAEPGDVLLEIGVEELPAQDVDAALTQLRERVSALFAALRLPHKQLHIFATPRRLVIIVEEVAPRQEDEEFVAKGPPKVRAYDADGKPTKAAEGFARSRGVSVDDLGVEEIDGNEYVTAKVHNEGQPATVVLQEAFPQLIADLKFGKSMHWNESKVFFSRPIRWIVALFGEIQIPFVYAGLHSGNQTRGLRPYGSPTHTVKNADDYLSAMAEQNIYLNHDERREVILDQISGLAERIEGTIPDDPGLLDEVTNLVEAPMAFLGQFEAQYLDLPREVLVTVMRKHQRYFPVLDDEGNLKAYFIGVRNGDQAHLDLVRKGNEQVIRARFSDAKFFYDADLKKPLQEHMPRLNTLVFHEKLGSMREKNDRVAALVPEIGGLLNLDDQAIATTAEAASIAKADLATQMVVEMTSLQGIMGREYALKEGRAQDVAVAVREHWLPAGAGDALPQTEAGALLAITDKLDSLVGLFAAGLAPKSTSDPFGLRRAALGVVQILNAQVWSMDLREALRVVAARQPIELSDDLHAQLLDFMRGRLDSFMEEEVGAPRDIINAVLAEQAHNPARAFDGIEQLEQWVQHDNWEYILDNFARCVRISRGESERYEIDEAYLQEDVEKKLYVEIRAAQQKLTDADNVDKFLATFEPMVETVFQFFEAVMVNDEDANLRHNRLGMMQAISDLATGRADLSELSGF